MRRLVRSSVFVLCTKIEGTQDTASSRYLHHVKSRSFTPHKRARDRVLSIRVEAMAAHIVESSASYLILPVSASCS
jgi:hypothetical protein